MVRKAHCSILSKHCNQTPYLKIQLTELFPLILPYRDVQHIPESNKAVTETNSSHHSVIMHIIFYARSGGYDI